ncbi:SDR family NAD(P)-dependent oxidoreductase [Enterovirga rhinocerotis]|uniref:3-oxoacyl-[acyl-carrier protein] reductase n=1 Tax=Enterovirga rhinocerotis TaxID=1339210 RepID=A0A4V3DXB4_9HYPH|nr:SDR family oxidoreductase [Enterovirga rhinocerotis]TDR88029.1 3-oxoacyl-[acyl-carrier protein] reductase [Enterovirga rhinocerotis]
MSEFEGKTIVVTGAAGAIGAEVARMAAARGARLLLVDPNEVGLEELAAALPGSGHVVAPSLLHTPEACADALSRIEGPLYGLVHMAGIYVPHDLEPGARSVYDRTLAANTTNAFDLACAMLPRLVEDEPARLVFASSQAFRKGSLGHVAYSVAKGGVVGLVRALSRNLKARALVNGVAPGVIDTPMPAHVIEARGEDLLRDIPLGRLGRADEVAGVCIFLLGPLSTYVTGQIINIDGGVHNA